MRERITSLVRYSGDQPRDGNAHPLGMPSSTPSGADTEGDPDAAKGIVSTTRQMLLVNDQPFMRVCGELVFFVWSPFIEYRIPNTEYRIPTEIPNTE